MSKVQNVEHDPDDISEVAEIVIDQTNEGTGSALVPSDPLTSPTSSQSFVSASPPVPNPSLAPQPTIRKSPVAGPSGLQKQPIAVSQLHYDTSSSEIDPEDVVPEHLRQKPSQVPRRRNITPPRSASSSPNTNIPLPINNYIRAGGG